MRYRKTACRPISSRPRSCARSRSWSSAPTRSKVMAQEWSQAVAVQGLSSPDDMVAQFESVSVADVDRVLRTYLDNQRAVAAYAVPKNAGAASSGGEHGEREQRDSADVARAVTAMGAARARARCRCREQTLAPADMTLLQRHSLDRSARTHHAHGRRRAARFSTTRSVQEPAGSRGRRRHRRGAAAVRHDDLRSRRAPNASSTTSRPRRRPGRSSA